MQTNVMASLAPAIWLGVMVVALLLAVRCCYPKDSWRLGLLALTLALAAVVMNVVAGYQMKDWGLRTEKRLEMLERNNSNPSSHGTTRQVQRE